MRHEQSARRYSVFYRFRFGLTLRGACNAYDSFPPRDRDAPLARASFLHRLARCAFTSHHLLCPGDDEPFAVESVA
jgi:hypothetical protein